jgi:flagellar protein FliS
VLSVVVNPHLLYKQNQVDTVSPAQLILMLYNGAIKFIKIARCGLEEKNAEKSHTAIVKVQDIIFELMACLDHRQGEVAGNLYTLYDYMNSRLLAANIKKDPEPLHEVEKMLTELRDTWCSAMKLAQ